MVQERKGAWPVVAKENGKWPLGAFDLILPSTTVAHRENVAQSDHPWLYEPLKAKPMFYLSFQCPFSDSVLVPANVGNAPR